jgi:hypothetical protein
LNKTYPKIGFNGHMALMLNAVLKAHAIEYFESSHAQSVSLTSEHFGAIFVDDSGSHAATGHPVSYH